MGSRLLVTCLCPRRLEEILCVAVLRSSRGNTYRVLNLFFRYFPHRKIVYFSLRHSSLVSFSIKITTPTPHPHISACFLQKFLSSLSLLEPPPRLCISTACLSAPPQDGRPYEVDFSLSSSPPRAAGPASCSACRTMEYE